MSIFSGQSAAPFLESFYEELRAAGIDVLDLTPAHDQESRRANAVSGFLQNG